MRILVATDAWRPQVNGVVRTYEQLSEQLPGIGAAVELLAPDRFRTLPCPTYPQIALAVPDRDRCARFIDGAKPDAIHIATEGPVGLMARAYCLRRRLPFTTSFHTKFPEYFERRFAVPGAWTYALLRRFHNAGAGTMVATRSLRQALAERGFRNLLPWTRGVDMSLFRPSGVRRFGEQRVFLYAGRVAVEKDIAAFLELDLPGAKVVVGDGPQLDELTARYPGVVFTGALSGRELADAYASADVFVFPSVTETFGIVMLEAMACGVPVAALPVTGPIDVVTQGVSGILSHNLREAALAALALDRVAVRRAAEAYTWDAAARLFVENVERALFVQRGRPLPLRFAGVPRLAR
ncbi:MAG: glycosyltransferase family 1 protein [Hyphomicrobiaceae bacterium]|jgi:glycosyltransferase involved in cell wall biosynthesis|nr:glycosyltransferase family 1 protein [Hyphomicrobiaceae bacterium]